MFALALQVVFRVERYYFFFLLGVAGINETSSQTAYPGQLEDTGWSDKSSGVAKVRCCSFLSLSFLWPGTGNASNINKQSS